MCFNFSKFLDVTNVSISLMYWFIWPTGEGKFIESQEAKRLWPHLVIDFLEKNLKTEKKSNYDKEL